MWKRLVTLFKLIKYLTRTCEKCCSVWGPEKVQTTWECTLNIKVQEYKLVEFCNQIIRSSVFSEKVVWNMVIVSVVCITWSWYILSILNATYLIPNCPISECRTGAPVGSWNSIVYKRWNFLSPYCASVCETSRELNYKLRQ